MPIDSKMVYHSASRLALFVALVLIIEIVVAAVTAFSIAGQIHYMEAARAGATISQAQAEAHDARQQLLGSIEIPTTIAAAILFLVWVYRVSRNVWALEVNGMNYTPGWSVGWFLVPLAGLFIPYFVMREIWQASSRGSSANERLAPASPVLGAWWLVSIVYSMMHWSPWRIIAGPMQLAYFHENDVIAGALWEFSWGLLIAEIVGIVASVLTIVIVVRVTEFQEHRWIAMAPTTVQS